MNLQKQAFTLVELIVVVTILAVLATIGFVSYSGYLVGTRDTNRVSNIKALSDGLELYRTKHNLPLPEDYIEVQINSNIIAYQGYVGQNVLETIEFSNGGKDPKYDTYFSYYLTKDKKYFQLMGYLEKEENLQVSDLDILKQTKADIPIYSKLYPTVYGKKLGILTTIDNVPIQEDTTISNSGYLNITSSSNIEYIARFSDNDSLTSTGLTLMSINPIGSCKRIKELKGGSQDGVYNINPTGTGSFNVYCDMTTDGGGWTMIGNAIGEDTSIYDYDDIVNWIPKNSNNCSLTQECISNAGNYIQGWNSLLVYTRGYAVKGENCNDKNLTIDGYSQLSFLNPVTVDGREDLTLGAHGRCDSLSEVFQGEKISDQAINGWPIRMGIQFTSNDSIDEHALLFFGPTYIPQGFGTKRAASTGKIKNHYTSDTENQVNLWDGASIEKQTWFIR